MKIGSLGILSVAFAAFGALPVHSQVLANAAGNYQTGTIDTVMTPTIDTHGTGTWTYDLAFVNSDSNPTAIGSTSILTYENNTNGGAGPYYGTNGTYPYSLIQLPIVSNIGVFPDSPNPAPAGYLELHPGDSTAAAVVEWTAGLGETGLVKLTFDLSRTDVASAGISGSQGFDDFGVYRGATKLYGDNAMYLGAGPNADTGLVTMYLSGITVGTKLDFVLSSTNGVLGYNLGLLDAQIEAIPEPGTWALMFGGLAFLVVLQRSRKKSTA
jgi:hypothetical protein